MLTELSALCETRLSALFSNAVNTVPALPLRESMHYALSNGGKRLRPLLIYATGEVFNTPLENLDAPAAAIEMIHTYSLIHDDLPCMDNADLRRGKPACHKAFGEGMAVLAGDALQTLAIDTLLHTPSGLSPKQRLDMLTVLSHASGAAGMASGQALDITVMSDGPVSLALLEDIYHLKTGALLTACLKLGWLASGDQQESNLIALTQFGDAIGLAFQIQDDILDIEASSETLGKPQGIDNINNKNTYPALVGLEAAKARVESLYEAAMESINVLGGEAQVLRELASHMLARKK
ncbi:MAG TPA: farnesyl diphosphate synthase [Gammaproteobacteria bacterium]|nr:farnesyl diphosphate synthase [Gammaproteobacteria bacterium]